MNFKSLLEGFSFNTERIEYKNSFWPRTIREWNKLPLLYWTLITLS